MNKTEAGAVLSINLGAVSLNWQALRAMLGNEGSCAAVVKSDAYGLGAANIASVLQRTGCNEFFVAYLWEGIELRRKLGANARIFVLHGAFDGTEPDFGAYNLIPVLNTMKQIDNWISYTSSVGHRFPVALHFDTGMSRLGFSAKERWELLGDKSDKLKNLEVILVMSHLANADIPDDAKNALQLSTFTQIKNNICKVLGYTPKFSLSATAGMLLGKDYMFDITRPGCGLYGFYPADNSKDKVKLSNVLTLEARILQVQEAVSGQGVGYGSTYRFAKGGKIATAALGYADGFKRALGNKGFGFIGDYKVPVVGRVSMDLTTFDVTDVPESVLLANPKIEIIGRHISLESIAKSADTIPYEVVTDIGSRYYRQYVNELFEMKNFSGNAANTGTTDGV